MTGPLAAWVRDPALGPVWAAARERLERNGVEPRGTVTVAGLDRAGRHAVSGLLGRPVVRERVRLDLEQLDAALRQRSGIGGLVAVIEAVGGPVRNRRVERSARTAEREAPFAAAREWLSRHPGVASQEWVEPWLSGLRQAGTVARGGGSTHVLVLALEVVTEVERLRTERPGGAVGRNEMAARVTGDAHALDDGSVLAQAVLRALALADGEPVPSGPAERRLRWELHGVLTDAVSSTCLVLGLHPAGDGGVARRLAVAADAGDPVHVTGWDLAREPLAVRSGTTVLVCENPRVLETVARRSWTGPGERPAVVCTSGVPGLVTTEVLHLLAACGTRLAYHGDFDWPGIAMADRLVAQIGSRPWRMGAVDYLRGVRADGPPLVGVPVEASWDARLRDEMLRHGRAVHEEAQLDELLESMPELASYLRSC